MKLFLAVLFAFPTLVFATAQVSDILIYQGKSESIFSTPLEKHFSEANPRPTWLSETNTACWRGYIASWELIDAHLYLTKIVRDGYDSAKDSISLIDITKRIFPGSKSPIAATWYSGVIRIPQGKELEYVHMGFESVYEKDLFLEFKDGILIKTRLVNNVPKREVSRRYK